MHGVYTRNLTSYESALPNYTIASEITGKRVTSFKLATEEKIYDKDGKEVDEIPEGANEADYKKEEVNINSAENLTKENYKKAKEIFDGRLKELGVADYAVRLDEETGNIAVELPDNIITDTLLQYLLCKGDFAMQDSEDKTVLIEKSDIKNASVRYGNDQATGAVIVYVNIKFTNEGAKKLAEVSKNYLKPDTDNNQTNTVENAESTDTTSNEQSKVTITLEGNDIMSTYFADVMENGELPLQIGSGTNNTTVYELATQAQVYAMLLNNGEMPLEYDIEITEYMTSGVSQTSLYIAIGIVLGVATLLIIYLILKYKVNGLLSSIALVSSAAILLLMIRYTGTTISIGGLTAILALVLFDGYFIIKILKDIKDNPNKDNVRLITYRVYLQKLDLIVVFLIIAVVFTFMPEVEVFSIGMTLFYGLISLIISNLIIMRQMLIAKSE